jgi:putative FmdB family regulatory protein
MPIYEYFCRDCHLKYEERRPMSASDDAATCPQCHEQNSVRVLSMIAMHVGGRSIDSAPSESASLAAGGGCCGGACGCGAHSHSLN